jgi:hypothetical protein
LTTTPRRPSPAARASRRSRRPAGRSASFLERNRTRLLWAGGFIVFLALLFVGLILPSITPAYDCTNTFDPSPAPSWTPPPSEPLASGATPGPAATAPAAGYVEPDMGHNHVDVGTRVKYPWCPPASGKHYNAAGQGQGPIKGGFYAQGDRMVPEGWIHNLEHGAIVLLYKCPGDGCTDTGEAAMQAMLARWPDSPICHTAPGTLTPVITRFDDMPYPYAAVVWDMVLPLQTLDEQAVFDFWAAYGEQFNPEKLCTAPTASPGPTPTAAPATPSPAPTAAPTGAPTAPLASGESAAPAAP